MMNSTRRTPVTVRGFALVLACAPALLSLAARPADACGGLFCSNSPVDQNAERILFRVGPNGAVTATVEITFTGDPEEFSWIVPVTETPTEMAVEPPSALRLLDNATAPTIIPPPTTCSRPPTADFGSGAEGEGEGEGEGEVVVEELPVVGGYQPEVISSTNAEALITWLEENEYVITDAMKPLIELYVGDGFKFLGVKLTADAGVSDIAPLSFTCPNGAPLVPLMLTAVASEPDMGVLVFIAAGQRYGVGNYREIQVDTDLVRFDPQRNASNYYPLVSWLVDEEGGKAFVTEYARPSSDVAGALAGVNLNTPDIDDARAFAEGVVGEHAYLTRLYTRMSGWEMDDDPVFAPSTGGDVSGVHDLSGRPPVNLCDGNSAQIPCGQTYCGAGQRCARTESGVDACMCEPGFVARRITAPVGRGRALTQTVTCQDASLDMLQSLEGELVDPCAGFSCGEGTCVAVNGFPTCECAAGHAARVDFRQPRGLTCEPVVSLYEPEALLWPDATPLSPLDAAACGCESAGSGGATLGLFGALFALAFVLTRRRR